MSAISEYTPHRIPVSVVKYDGPHHEGVHLTPFSAGTRMVIHLQRSILAEDPSAIIGGIFQILDYGIISFSLSIMPSQNNSRKM